MLNIFLLSLIAITVSDASHFRGGTINWKPTNNVNEIEFRFKLGWTYGNGAGCYESLVGQYVTSGTEASGQWICTSGCSTQISLSNTSYICTGASSTEEWEQGEYTFRYTFPNKGPFTIGFSGSAWMSLNYGGASGWNIETVVDLRTRNDTKRINSSPISGSRPMYKLQYGCNNTLTLPMTDADGDIVKCRWSKGTECASVCNGLPNAVLDEDTCTLTFHATTANNYTKDGWYAVALTIEDYPRSTISIDGTTVLPTTPISTSPIQFLINTPSLNGSCDERPIFVNDTPQENKLIVIKARQSLNICFYAKSKFSITGITLMSPGGLQKSALSSDNLGRADVSYINVTWTPRQTDQGAHLLCGTAEDARGKMSVPRCMTILAWDDDPCDSIPCQNNGTCNRIGFSQDFNCICSPGYTGVLCETNDDPCNSVSCQNNGTCNRVGYTQDYYCICSQGYTGNLCETNDDPCNSVSCQNNGICNRVGYTQDYYCICSQGYTGNLCETNDDPCNSVSCQHNGTCNRVGYTQDYNCICSQGYTGNLCETIRINLCRNSPCLHGGTCIDQLAKYTCICNGSWYGHICEYRNSTFETINEYSNCKCVIGPMKRKSAKNRDVLCGFIGMLISLSLVILTYYLRMRHLNNKETAERNWSASSVYPDIADVQYKKNLYIYR